jgi:signal transduction histidine kinase
MSDALEKKEQGASGGDASTMGPQAAPNPGARTHDSLTMGPQAAPNPGARTHAASPVPPELALMDRLRHEERLAMVGKLASHMAHELGTPLNVIEARALMMASGELTGAAAQKNAQIIAEQAARMTKIIRDILGVTRRPPLESSAFDLLNIAKSAVAMSQAEASRRGVIVELDPSSESAIVSGSDGRLLGVVMSLVSNGVQASPQGGTVTVATRTRRRPSADDPDGPATDLSTIEVRDHGRGIEPGAVAQIFKPFSGAKGGAEGIGLSLSVAQGIAREHGGFIEVESEVGKGSSFTVYLPRGVN